MGHGARLSGRGTLETTYMDGHTLTPSDGKLTAPWAVRKVEGKHVYDVWGSLPCPFLQKWPLLLEQRTRRRVVQRY